MTTSTTPTCADCGQSTGEIIHGQLSGQTFHEDVTDCNEALKLALAAATQDAARWRAVRAQWLGFDFEYEGNPLQPFVAVFSMPHGFMMMEPIDPDHYADQLVARAGGV